MTTTLTSVASPVRARLWERNVEAAGLSIVSVRREAPRFRQHAVAPRRRPKIPGYRPRGRSELGLSGHALDGRAA